MSKFKEQVNDAKNAHKQENIQLKNELKAIKLFQLRKQANVKQLCVAANEEIQQWLFEYVSMSKDKENNASICNLEPHSLESPTQHILSYVGAKPNDRHILVKGLVNAG